MCREPCCASGDGRAAAFQEDDVAPVAVMAADALTMADDTEPGALVEGEAGVLAVLLPPDRPPFPVIDSNSNSDPLHSLDALIGLDTLHSRLGPLLAAPAADPDGSVDDEEQRFSGSSGGAASVEYR